MTQYKNKLTAHKNIMEKFLDYKRDCQANVLAHKSDGTTVPLSAVKLSNVKFIAGLWRVQNPFPYKIQSVQDKRFVLVEKLPYDEKSLFEFYRASGVAENFYGTFILPGNQIVAKCTTDRGIYWSCGDTIEQARAFLEIGLFDEHTDAIRSIARYDTLSRQKK